MVAYDKFNELQHEDKKYPASCNHMSFTKVTSGILCI